MNTLKALLTLTKVPFLGNAKIRWLVDYFGSLENVMAVPPHEIEHLKGFGPKIAHYWKTTVDSDVAEREIELAEKYHTKIITYLDVSYPKKLTAIEDPPILLYVQGELKKEDECSLSVVGTRQATHYGLDTAYALSKELAAEKFTIISGLARGVDTAAHRGAIETGRSLAVIGSGLAAIYPTENKGLAKAIIEKGALLSEFSMNTPPEKFNFPKRNRIVSALSLGTLLIEAPLKSGAMLTAERAMSQGRPLFALPGRVDMETFSGNHKLIKEKKAHLIENAADILSFFGRLSCGSFIHKKENEDLLSLEEAELLEKLPKIEISIEAILALYSCPIAKLGGLLMSLVLKKRIKEYPGKIYKKI